MSETKTPIKAIRAKCLDCSGGSAQEVRLCVIPECPLYPYRMGKNPNRQGKKLTEDEKAAVSARLSKARSSRSLTR